MAAKKEPASAPVRASDPIVTPDVNEAPSSDSTHYVVRVSQHQFPDDQGSQVEQVFDAVK